MKIIKRLADIIFAFIALSLLCPVIAFVAVIIRLKMGRGVLFKQVRPGYREQPFTCLKFRTMLDIASPDGLPLPDVERLTRLGKFLRKTSLDELPQLFNVLVGDISLVGPRPLLVRYLDRYSPEQRRRHDARPGITGWAQVNGRNLLSWEEKFAFDVWYVDHWSLWLDIKILFMTFAKVLKGSGTSAAKHATMPEFMGTEESTKPEDNTDSQ
ncbi:MAG TPA: sugar transferase [Phycisphaerae bacterium]|nr:sugar transferase [Phycisphaerae bacterium]